MYRADVNMIEASKPLLRSERDEISQISFLISQYIEGMQVLTGLQVHRLRTRRHLPDLWVPLRK